MGMRECEQEGEVRTNLLGADLVDSVASFGCERGGQLRSGGDKRIRTACCDHKVDWQRREDTVSEGFCVRRQVREPYICVGRNAWKKGA